jgi:hypothetical protein
MTTRTIKKLLELLLDTTDSFCTGLCGWVAILGSRYIINLEEYYILTEYIKNNRPQTKAITAQQTKDKMLGYYWTSGEIEPRIEWIKEHIEKLKQQE